MITNRVARWKLVCDEFNFVLRHIKGLENDQADYLSRINNLNICMKNTYDLPIKEYLSTELCIKFNEDKYDLNDEPIYVKRKCVELIHFYYGHPGMRKTLKIMNYIVCCKGMTKIIEEVLKECQFCQENKVYKSNMCKLNFSSRIPEKLKHISSDIYGPIQLYNKDEKDFRKIYIITIQINIRNMLNYIPPHISHTRI